MGPIKTVNMKENGAKVDTNVDPFFQVHKGTITTATLKASAPFFIV